jgi:hypothetical protein
MKISTLRNRSEVRNPLGENLMEGCYATPLHFVTKFLFGVQSIFPSFCYKIPFWRSIHIF